MINPSLKRCWQHHMRLMMSCVRSIGNVEIELAEQDPVSPLLPGGEWEIKSSRVAFDKRPDGSLVELGCGMWPLEMLLDCTFMHSAAHACQLKGYSIKAAVRLGLGSTMWAIARPVALITHAGQPSNK